MPTPTCAAVLKNSKLSLKPEQVKIAAAIYEQDLTFIVATTGFGKTAVCLHAIAEYLDNDFITQAIIVAPASVVTHWPVESAKWGLSLDVQAVVGTPEQRAAIVAAKPQVLVISLNNLEWLLKHGCDATMIVIDEISKASGKQTKMLRHKKWKDAIVYRVGMSATPVAENFEKLFGMVRVLDSGARLGRSKERFMQEYFIQTDYKGYKHDLAPKADEKILAVIADILYVVESDKEKSLPALTYQNISYQMSEDAREAYDELRKHMLVDIQGDAVEAANQAVVSGKLRQISGGFIIDNDGEVIELDTNRAAAVYYTVHHAIPAKAQVLILYSNDHQRQQLADVFAGESMAFVYGGSDKEAALTAFKSGAVRLLIAQESTLSHGVDGLQDVCCNMIFMSLPWSADTKIQAIGRLHRTGQANPVKVFTIECEKSIDQLVALRQENKAGYMKKFIQHLKG